MIRSANEIEAMVIKACRGAGIPLSQAQQVGRSTSRAPGAVSVVLDHLDRPMDRDVQISGGVVFRPSHLLCDLPLALDALQAGADMARLCAQGGNDLVVAMCQGLPVTYYDDGDDLVLTPGADQGELPCQRCEISDENWAALDAFAALTYVPETAQSRLAGAGAGLTDND